MAVPLIGAQTEFGNALFKKIAALKFDGTQPTIYAVKAYGKRLYHCEIKGSGITPGIGRTKDEAYVDFIEELASICCVFGEDIPRLWKKRCRSGTFRILGAP